MSGIPTFFEVNLKELMLISSITNSGCRGLKFFDDSLTIPFSTKNIGAMKNCSLTLKITLYYFKIQNICPYFQSYINWHAEFDLPRMCLDSWNWHSLNPEGYPTNIYLIPPYILLIITILSYYVFY